MTETTLLTPGVADAALTSLVVSLLGRDGDDSVCAAAVDMGRRFGAHVTAVHGIGDPREVLAIVGPGATSTMAETLAAAAAEQIEARRRRALAVYRKYVDETATATRGFSLAWAEDDGRPGEVMARHAVGADLTVTARPDGDAERVEVFEAALFQGGGPVLSVPPGAAAVGGQHITVAWDGGAPAGRALRSARPLLRQAEAVTVLTVRSGREAAAPSAVVDSLTRIGVAARAEVVDAADQPIGTALLSAAADRDCDMLVAGAYGHNRVRELILGGTTRDLVQRCPVPTWFSH